MTLKTPVVGGVGAKLAAFKRQGDRSDYTAAATRGGSSPLAKVRGFQTPAEKQKIALQQRQKRMQGRGYTGNNPTAQRIQKSAGIVDNTNSYDRIYNLLLETTSSPTP